MGDEWIQKISRKRNMPYYFNTRTGVTQWNKPPGLSQKTRYDQNLERKESGEEKDERSAKKAKEFSSGTGTESKSSSIKDSASASKAIPSGTDAGSLPGNQQSLPRVILPRKRRKRKKLSSSSSEYPQEEFKETKRPEPADKCNLLAGPPAKRTQAVKPVMKDTIRPKDVNKPREEYLTLKETSSASHSLEQTSPESFSLMEVDLPLRTEGKVLVVVDTNVLINSVDYLQRIKGKTIKDLGDIMLTIPWIVMEELDQLKGPNCIAITPLSSAVRKALGFLHKNRTDPNIKGQSYNHFMKTRRGREVKGSNDDMILYYCLQCKKKYPGNLVVLLSNDKNLCLKASFSGVPSSGDKDFRNEISKQANSHARLSISSDDNEVSSPTKDQPSSGRSSPEGAIACISPIEFKGSGPFQSSTGKDSERRIVSWPTQESDGKRSTPTVMKHQSITNSRKTSSPKQRTDVETKSNIQIGENEVKKLSTCTGPVRSAETNLELKKEKSCKQLSSESVTERKKKEKDYTKDLMGFLKLMLVIILRHEMMESYTNHWLDIVHKKPPWSLIDALQCIKKHYVAVFGLLLGRRNADEVDRLIAIVKNVRDDDVFSSKQLETFYFATKEILIPLKKNAKYKDIATKCEDDIKRVYQQCKQTVQDATQTRNNTGFQRATKTPLRISSSSMPVEEKESVQESEEMCISPPATTSSNGLETALLIKNQEAREEIEERREGDGMDHVTFCVLSVFEAVYTVLKYHRDVIVWSFKHLASGCPIEGLPTKDESLNYLSTALPLIEVIVQSLQRLIGSCIPVPAVLCEEVVHSLHAYVQALKLDLDIGGFHAELFQQFILSEDNRQRIVRGSQQYSEVLQQLHECRATLSQF
ncbi:transcriptional protein SWT1-like [Lytechinus variegatus]|uniref:transcriptional protein SWT1-like n=1 Tax=Lytechinus variegatus TaxID=7654 RepID=UPI001BB27AA5|nr:transcriptional protein SWT1-like [Lytechinus variegatus]XP_041480998.1 transcriptional protein SWT1-like [Lytechinus variegatus]